MNRMLDLRSRTTLLALFAVVTVALATSGAPAQDALGRKALDHDDYDKWNSVSRPTLSEDGSWIAYTIRGSDDASTLFIRDSSSDTLYDVENGSRLTFTYDSTHAIYLINPDPARMRELRAEGARGDALPQPALAVLDLATGRTVTIPNVRSFDLPEEAGGWMTYTLTRGAESDTARAGKATLKEHYTVTEHGLVPASAAKPEQPTARTTTETGEQAGEPTRKRGQRSDEPEKNNGRVLVLRNLETGIERHFPDVSSSAFSKHGALLAIATSATDAEDDGVHIIDLADGSLTQIISGRGKYERLAFSDDQSMLAFLTDRDNYGPVRPSMSIYLWKQGDEAAEKIADEQSQNIPESWWIASSGVRFTEDGRRLIFATQPRPDDAGKTRKELEAERKAEALDPTPRLDIWHWKDPQLQPQQLIQAERERRRDYTAVYGIADKTIVQVAREDIPDVFIDSRSRADIAIGSNSQKYDTSRSWESPGFSDSYLVDLNTGEAILIFEKSRGRASLSPDGTYISHWDPESETHTVMSTTDLVPVDVSADIPTSLANELHDTPSPPRSYGGPGWIDDDAALLLYDRFDIWQIDPTGNELPRCLTKGAGRTNKTRYRYQRLDREERSIAPDGTIMLSVFNENTKASGYATLNLTDGAVTHLIMLNENIGILQKAQQGDTVLLTRETFRRYPDLWMTTLEFDHLTRLTEANPQQRDYLWGTAELVDYETTEGDPLQGILYKPDNFDPNHKYPMMVYFYERSSDRLHRYNTPAAGSSSINFSFYVSRGYVLFVPDIPYEAGYPGQSAENAVLPGIQTVVDMGFVDSERIGVQGHSWGGYQIAHLVTRTNMFACAEAGAPVTNMTSAYGGIRWASGLSRMFQYEKTQSRIGGTLWEARDLYLENSPVFFADQVETPLLMLHNDEDGAVPWYQGIEMFVAMRRLNKPVWMLNYNGEAHGLRRDENQLDWAKRMQQFFDHYLMDAPAPVWLAEGIPAVDKGKEFGFEYVEQSEE